MINAFYDRVERDELLSPFFPGGVSAAHRDHVAVWWIEVFGGPPEYTQNLGGYESMLAHHRGLAITGEQRFRFASLMSLAADDAEPARTTPNSGLRWSAIWSGEPGSRCSTRRWTREVVEHAPVPRWGWGVAPPYQP